MNKKRLVVVLAFFGCSVFQGSAADKPEIVLIDNVSESFPRIQRIPR